MSVSRRKNGMISWAPKNGLANDLSGSAQVLLVSVMTALFVSGGCYLYSVNQNAVEGYHMRTLEKEIALLEQKNAELRIVEADLRSLHRIEEVTSQELEMQKLENIQYREEREVSVPVATNHEEYTPHTLSGPVALR